jgi:hypothetical protein
MAMEQYSRLKVTFDEITGAMKLTGQEAVSLQKQVRLLKQELTLGSYTDAQFKQIQKALLETEVKLQQTQLRGKDLLLQIGTLGGPIGEMSNRIDRFVKLVGALNDITFDELKQQFKTLYLTFTGQADKISDVIDVAQTGGRKSGVRESVGDAGTAGSGLQAGAGAAQAYAAKSSIDAAKATEEFTKALASNAAENYKTAQTIKQLSGTNDLLVQSFKKGSVDIVTAQQNMVDAVKKRQEFEQSLINVSSAQKKILVEKYEAEQAANFAASKALQEYVKDNRYALLAAETLEKKFKDVTFVVQEGTIFIGVHDQALRALTDAENAAIISGKKLIITEEGLIVAEKEATLVTRGLAVVTAAYGKVVTFVSGLIQFGFTTALRTADIAAKILVGTLSLLGVVVGALFIGGQVLGPLIEWATGFAQAAAEAENLKVQLEAIKKVLNLDLADLKRRSAEGRAEMEKNNATSADLRKQDLKDAKSYYNTVTNALEEAREKERQAQIASSKRGGIFGVSKEAAEQEAKNVENAANLVLDLEQKQKDAANDINVKGNKNIEQTTKQSLNNRLKSIDAALEQQIESERTNSDELFKLYKERNEITDYLDKDHSLTQVEIQERKRIQFKKINDAIIDDNLRILKAEEDNIVRALDIAQKGGDHEYALMKQLAEKKRDIAYQEAKKDAKTKANNEKNADTELAKDLLEIDKKKLRDRADLAQVYFNAASENTREYFNAERQLLNTQYDVLYKDAEKNADKLLALKEEFRKKYLEVDAKELEANADIEKRKADVAMVSLKKEEVGFLESFGVIRDANKQKFQDLTDSENLEYEAKKVRAANNNEQLELIEKEHVLKLGEIEVQRVQSNQQINQLIIDSTAQFGAAISEIGAAIMEDAQGRDEKQFESAKNIAKGGVIVEKAAAIGQIWSNNAVANAKAVAAFPLTAGQPWVTINTVTAGLSTVTTIAAAAKAIAEIDNKKFDSGAGAKSSGRNYATGGMIDGSRHSQGGVPIEAEGGEAIMTRGAVTAFAPLLSTLNQMGGGTSFSQGAVGQAGFDFPQQSTQQVQQAQITKTYVVENELTTIQQRQARLKDLSTL